MFKVFLPQEFMLYFITCQIKSIIYRKKCLDEKDFWRELPLLCKNEKCVNDQFNADYPFFSPIELVVQTCRDSLAYVAECISVVSILMT